MAFKQVNKQHSLLTGHLEVRTLTITGLTIQAIRMRTSKDAAAKKEKVDTGFPAPTYAGRDRLAPVVFPELGCVHNTPDLGIKLAYAQQRGVFVQLTSNCTA